MSDPLEMSLDEYIEKKQIRVRDPMRFQRRQQISPRNNRSRGERGGTFNWRGRRPFGGQWQYVEEEDEDEVEEEDDEEEDDNRWQGRNYRCRQYRNNRPDNGRLETYRRLPYTTDRQDSPMESEEKKQEDGEAKLFVYNLHPEVSANDLKELFSALGAVKATTVHFNKLGQSLGSADVVYEKRTDAFRAIREYHGIPLDGQVMNIELIRSAEELGVPRVGYRQQRRYRRER